MVDSKDNHPDPPEKSPVSPARPSQPLVGFMTNAEWSELLAHTDGLIRELERLPYPHVKEQVFTLLVAIDTIHREALRRLVRLFKEGLLEQVVTDPAIHTLMDFYDLLPPGAKPPDEQRAKIVFTTGPVKPRPESKDKPRIKRPRWIPVSMKQDALPSGAVRSFLADERHILLCRAGESLFAVEALCLQDGSSLAGGTLSKYTLACPHHAGCYYDVRDGARIAGSGRLECFPVKEGEEGRILVGLDMDFSPLRPSF
jgi:nitrite reductase/ring-hydroxylating ferredoxin subunit